MNNSNNRKKENDRFMIIGILMVIGVLVFTRRYNCPLNRVFGIPCPCCGMSRAFFSLLKGRFIESFYYHPLWPLVVVGAICFILYLYEIIRPSKKVIRISLFSVAGIFMACYIYRHITHSPIVEINLGNSLLFGFFLR